MPEISAISILSSMSNLKNLDENIAMVSDIFCRNDFEISESFILMRPTKRSNISIVNTLIKFSDLFGDLVSIVQD